MIKKITQLLILLAAVFTCAAQNDDSVTIKKIADDILTNGRAYANLRILCKDIGPRLSGSPQAQKAVEATEKMLKEAGADTVYLQPCMVPHWVRGDKETGFIQTGGSKRMLHLTSLGNSPGTGKKGISAGIVEVKSMKELEQLGTSVIKGKIVFFNFAMDPTYIQTFRAYGESGISRFIGPSKAAALGAVGAIVRSLASNEDDFPHTGVTVYNDSFPKIPAVAISTNDANWLSKQLRLKMPSKASFTNTCKMLPDTISYNVVGELKGSAYPNQIITVGGHLDSWDLAEGANDDGTGIVQSIEVLRALKASGMQPKHTFRAVMFMNEENGGRGGDKYLELARKNKENHLFAFESDNGGFTPRGFSLAMNDASFKKILQWKNLFYNYGVYDFFAGGSGADIEGLGELGTALAELAPDSQRYFDIHHASTDVFENVSKRELLLGAVNITALIYLVDKYGL